MTRRCVYTCLIGDYEDLNEQPVAAESSLDFICFTDNPKLTSQTWRIVPTEVAFPLDHVRSQRVLKISPEIVLPEYDESLYIDNGVMLKVPPDDLIGQCLASTDFAIPWHSFRDSVVDEFLEVLRLGLDDGGRVVEQLNHYSMSVPLVLRERPYWSGMLFRRHGAPSLQRVMRLWLAHVLRYSRRDQLSLNYALGAIGVAPQVLQVDCHDSEFHWWPRQVGRLRESRLRQAAESMLPPPVLARKLCDEASASARLAQSLLQQADQYQADIATLRHQLESAAQAQAEDRQGFADQASRQQYRLDAAISEIEGLRESLGARSALVAQAEGGRREATTRAEGLAAELSRLEEQVRRAQADARTWQNALEATRSSTSWRVTAPLRRLAFLRSRRTRVDR